MVQALISQRRQPSQIQAECGLIYYHEHSAFTKNFLSKHLYYGIFLSFKAKPFWVAYNLVEVNTTKPDQGIIFI